MTPPASLTSAVLERKGRREGSEIRFQCPEFQRHRNGDANPSARYHTEKSVWTCDVCKAGGGWRDLARRLGLSFDRATQPRPEVVAKYVYCRESGEPLRRKLRFEPGFHGRRKSFSWQKLEGGRWVKTSGDGNPGVLYGSERLPGARESGATVFAVEGEKDCDRGTALGLVTVCNPEGAATDGRRPKWKAHYSAQLRALSVVVISDKDDPGRAHSKAVAAHLTTTAHSVRVLELPGDDVKDFSDWISARRAEGADREALRVELERLVEEAKPWGKSSKPSSNGTTRGMPTQAQELIALAQDVTFFHDSEATAYATFEQGGHRETRPVRSRGFRELLLRRFFGERGKPPSPQPLKATLDLFEARARYEGEQRSVYLRVAPAADETLCLDLGDSTWGGIEIDPTGWRLVAETAARFRRSDRMLPLPTPSPEGSAHSLRPYVNTSRDDDFILVVAWLIAALRPIGPYPILVLQGEQGTAKSTLSRMLRALIDPCHAPLQAAPREERDLMIAARNSWVLAFDNLSGLPGWLSDALCRLATGGGFVTRRLYSDDEEVIFSARRPVILNGIPDLATRQDLMDRALVIHLEPIAEAERRTETDLRRTYEIDRPQILGGLLHGCVTALRDFDRVEIGNTLRMADFVHWMTAAEPGLGFDRGRFLAAYRANRGDAVELALEADLVATAVRQFMERRGRWTGTASDLHEALRALLNERQEKSRGWPKSASALSNQLKRATTALRSVGVAVERHKTSDRDRRRLITLRTRSADAVRTVQTAPDNSQSDGADGADNDSQRVSDGLLSQRAESKPSDEWGEL